MSKRLEYKVLKVALDDLEATLNIYAQDDYRADHLFEHSENGLIILTLSRKQKSATKHHEVFEREDE